MKNRIVCLSWLLTLLVTFVGVDVCRATIKVKVGNQFVLVDDILDNSDSHYLNYVRFFTVPFEKRNGVVWNQGVDAAAIRALETDRIQLQIFRKMRDNAVEFSFSDVVHAGRNVQARLSILKKMNEFNTVHQYQYYPVDENLVPRPSTTAKNWKKNTEFVVPVTLLNMENLKFHVSYYFSQYKGTPSESIKQLCDKKSVTKGECLGAIEACIWWGVQQAWDGPTGANPSVFDAFCGQIPLPLNLKPLAMHHDPRFTTVGWMVKSYDASYSLVPGDWVYFKNSNYEQVAMYKEYFVRQNLMGKGAHLYLGENALYTGDDEPVDGVPGQQRFEGLGANFANLTADQMKEKLYPVYNKSLEKVIAEAAKNGGTIYAERIDEFVGTRSENLTVKTIQKNDVEMINIKSPWVWVAN